MAFAATQQRCRDNLFRVPPLKGQMKLEQLLERVQSVWDEARGPRPLPSRTDIDPVRLGPALQHVSVLDVVSGDPLDFRYRLMGQQLIKGYGANLAGQLHTVVADRSRSAWPFYEALVSCTTTQRPYSFDIQTRNRNEVLVDAKGRIWPLSDDGQAVTGLLAACIYFVPQTLTA